MKFEVVHKILVCLSFFVGAKNYEQCQFYYHHQWRSLAMIASRRSFARFIDSHFVGLLLVQIQSQFLYRNSVREGKNWFESARLPIWLNGKTLFLYVNRSSTEPGKNQQQKHNKRQPNSYKRTNKHRTEEIMHIIFETIKQIKVLNESGSDKPTKTNERTHSHNFYSRKTILNHWKN